MATDVSLLRPGAVVIEFSGSALAPCMLDSTGRSLFGNPYFERYAADPEQAIRIFSDVGTQLIFASAPITQADAATDASG